MIVLHLVFANRSRADGVTVAVDSLSAALNLISGNQSLVLDINFTSPSRLLRLCRNVIVFIGRADLVVFHGVYRPFFWVASLYAKLIGRRYIVVPHCSLISVSNAKGYWKKKIAWLLFVRSFIYGAEKIQFLNEVERSKSMLFDGGSFIVGNGLELPDLNYLQKRRDFHRRSRKDRTAINIVFLGRIDIRHKGLDILVSAVGRSAIKLREVDAVVNIYGPDSNGQKLLLVNLAASLLCEDLIRFHGNIHRRKIPEVFAKADVLVMCSRYEGEPLSVLEAVAHGVPAILSEGTNVVDELARNGLAVQFSGDIVNDLFLALDLANDNEFIDRAVRFGESKSWSNIADQAMKSYVACLSR